MREKVIAVCFLVFIFAISGQTIYDTIRNEYLVVDTVPTEVELSQSATEQVEVSEESSLTQLSQEELDLKDEMQEESDEENNTSEEESSNLIQDFSDKFTQNIATKEEFVQINTNASAVMSSQTYFESTQVLLGKDNWLFYKSADDGTSIADYQGTGHYSEEKLAEIADNLIKQRDVLAQQEIRFVVYIVPNKEVIYFEYMPDTIYRESTVTRTDELVNYLRENTDLEVVYPKNELMYAKEDQLVYFKYDTHWNYVGGFIGIQCLLNQLYNTYHDVSEMTFVESPSGVLVQNDLAIIANVADLFQEESMLMFSEEYILEEQVVSDTILFVGDSFGITLSGMGQSYFPSGSNYIGVWTSDMSTIQQYNPDIVVWESVERYTDRMHYLDITAE